MCWCIKWSRTDSWPSLQGNGIFYNIFPTWIFVYGLYNASVMWKCNVNFKIKENIQRYSVHTSQMFSIFDVKKCISVSHVDVIFVTLHSKINI